MDIDWSKAPEGATHWDTGLHDRTPGWMRQDGSTWYWWPVDGAKFERKWFVCCETYPSETKEFVARPAAWSGEGRPPVGTLCEAEIYDGKGMLVWREARVIHHHPRREGSAAIAHGYEELLAWTSSFRPIRTPEQIAAEEREKAIKEMLSVCPYPGSHDGVARAYTEALYDAGWRRSHDA